MADDKHVPPTTLDVHSGSYVESLFNQFLQEHETVSEDWHTYLSEVSPGLSEVNAGQQPNVLTGQSPFAPSSAFNPPTLSGSVAADATAALRLQHRVDQLVAAYRGQGHRAAHLDPLNLAKIKSDFLEPSSYGLSASDDASPVVYQASPTSESQLLPLGELRQKLSAAYCQDIGFEFAHIQNPKMRDWLQRRVENRQGSHSLPRKVQLQILAQLSKAYTFEQFVRRKYVGSKTFSLEGAETLIPLLDLALENAARRGVKNVVIGMAHRGRLNVLANIVGKRPVEIFREFEDQHPDWWRGRGDVKYHLGASGDWRAADGSKVHVSLCFNPSHLEFVDPVALGRVRAKQDRSGDTARKQAATFLIHGDAAFAGEGVVQESLNLAGLKGYHTGGTLHIVVNNQVGFTTPPKEARSTEYATDIAKAMQIPIFHVNGELPYAVASVVELAMDFRAEFGHDAVIDMYCYRRWGHNEADEPSFTQPIMYREIDRRDSIYQCYREHLLKLEQVTSEEADQIATQQREMLEEQFEEAQQATIHPYEAPRSGVWQLYCGGPSDHGDTATSLPAEQLEELLEKLTTLPAGFHLHDKLQRVIEHRKQMMAGELPIDWSTAEALALASLAVEGTRIRLSGQDSGRGTFSQRHALLNDSVDGHQISIFDGLSAQQAKVELINSPLCEAGALGFEYGFSLDYPDALVLWEAQFGDFVNAAQVIVDQFIASAEDKWERLSGLVMLLPHGFEGQGPEHSSARLERFLALAAEDNIQVVYPSTPAQYFHVLRRQVKRPWRKPLVVLTPKSLLRHRRMASPMANFTRSSFARILGDDRVKPSETSRVLLASGKVAFDLLEAREERQRDDIAILRVEQLYPLSDKWIAAALRPFADETPVFWVQEEPQNMGAWPHMKNRFGGRIAGRFPIKGITRHPSASPATGSSAAHKAEQQELIERSFNEAM